MNKKEIQWIANLNTKFPNGYNLTYGGDGGNTYFLLSEEDKRKFREKISKNHKGKHVSEETKKKLGVPKSEDHKQKLRKTKSESHRKKMREAWIERRKDPVSEETGKKYQMLGRGEINLENAKIK